MKSLPYDKTVVSELKVHLADLLTRSVVMKSAVSAPIPLEVPYNSGDAIISHGSPLQIQSTQACVILNSMEDFEVVFPGAEEVVLHCRGLFVNYGRSGRIVVRPPTGVEKLRLQYIWA
jgi:hypothetical protein